VSGVIIVSGIRSVSGVITVLGEGMVSGVMGDVSGVGVGFTMVVTGVFVPGRVATGVFVVFGLIMLSVHEERQSAENTKTAKRANNVFFIVDF